ncbi:MAG: response regulator [Magnetococcus sp. YQC-3]
MSDSVLSIDPLQQRESAVVKRILLIEDDLKLQAIYKNFLQEAGHETVATHSCWITLQLLEKNAVDLLITDIMAQDFDGIELIRILCALPKAPPIIAMTGSARRIAGVGLLAVAQELGVAGTLQKPFTRMELLDTVDRLLGEGRLRGAG